MNALTKAFSLPIAHRGLHNPAAGVVENSRQAFERAIQGGYGIECDLQLSGDGVPMVFHDDKLDRLTAQFGNISQLSAGQLQRINLKEAKEDAPIVRFSELLDLAGEKTPLVIELKHQVQNNQHLAQAAAKDALAANSPIVFKSFDPNLVIFTREAGFSGPIGIVTEGFYSDYARKNLTNSQRFNLRHLLHYPKTKFDFISCGHNDLKLPAVRLARKLGKKVMTWTVRSELEQAEARKHADQVVFEGYLPTIG